MEENVNRFVSLLLEPNYTIIMALVESLDTSDNKNNADEVAQTLLDFLVIHKRIIPVLNMLVSKEVEQVGQYKIFFKIIIFPFFLKSSKEAPSTLFRRNSVCSKMLSRFTKLNGQKFLDCILKNLIKDLNKKDKGQYEVFFFEETISLH